ncbi:MAG: hypothetical protein IKL52_01275 [Candidatus Gastranaerophilales bacterium]|nr:hypothetical protein [Candidatus Gastranaerophilales bacterium]
MNIIKIEHQSRNKIESYDIEIEKILFVLSKLENKEIKFESFEQIKKLMKKYKLFDEYFLKNINKL